jgi:hypothetical protein
MIMSPPATFRLLGERSSVASPGIGHFYFAQRGHYHFAGTDKSQNVKSQNALFQEERKRRKDPLAGDISPGQPLDADGDRA